MVVLVSYISSYVSDLDFTPQTIIPEELLKAIRP